jgi:NADH-quinone oxidoreductase subunit L
MKADVATESILMIVATVIALVSTYFAYNMYKKNEELALEDDEIESSTHLTLVNKYYIDELYDKIIRKPVDQLSAFIGKFIEPNVVDGLVKQVRPIPQGIGAATKLVQNGKMVMYILAMIIGLIVLLITLI